MIKVLVVSVLVLLASCIDEPEYTQDLAQFKKTKYNARLQLLVGCWLLVRDHQHIQQLDSARETQALHHVKICMKHITRKDAVVKVTSLIGKNMETPKKYDQIVPENESEPQNLSNYTKTSFDDYILSLMKNYDKELKEVPDLKDKIEGELQKRTKYYFGFIPANGFTHTVGLTTISVLLICMCTSCTYYRKRREEIHQKRVGKKAGAGADRKKK